MDWKDTLERAVWTGLEAPAAVALFDVVNTSAEMPPGTLFAAAGLGFALAALKAVGKDRLAWLRAKRQRGDHEA